MFELQTCMGTFFRTVSVHLIPSNRPNKVEVNIAVPSGLCTSIPRRKDSSTHTVTMPPTLSHNHRQHNHTSKFLYFAGLKQF